MANTVVIMSQEPPTKKRHQKRLTTETSRYLRLIEKLANEKLKFFREKELREEVQQQTEETKKSNRTSTCPWSTSVGKDVRKKRKVPKKAVRTGILTNEITEQLKEFIVDELKGTDMKLVIQKTLYNSDTKQSQNRLSMPMNQLETGAFLTEYERRMLDTKENKIEVPLVGPTLEMYEKPMELTMWHMARTSNYVLKTHWFQFWSDNREYLKEGSKVQVWSFRRSKQLCFAVACVEKVGGENDGV